MKTGLTFIRKVKKKGSAWYSEYECNVCGKSCIKAESNAKKCKSCNCVQHTGTIKGKSVDNDTYRKYAYIKLMYKKKGISKLPINYNTYKKFEDLYNEVGWNAVKTILQNAMISKKLKDKIFILYSLYKTRFKKESNIVICNIVAISLHLHLIQVCDTVNIPYVNNFDKKRQVYKRAWFIYRKEKLNDRTKR